MNATTATITGTEIVVAERNDMGLICQTLLTEVRPASFELADTALAFVSLGRTSAWELTLQGMIEAPVAPVDNRFNGTVAARLWEAVGTTHDEWIALPAREIQDGDLISDTNISAPYVVAGSRFESDSMRVHMVAEGKTWDGRYTADFPAGQLVQVARKR